MSRVQTIAFALFMLAAAIGCASLGLWQLDRLASRRALNVAALATRNAPVVDLTQPARVPDLDQRTVTATGRFDHIRSFILRSRPYRGFPGVQVVTPLLVDGSDMALLVNLGFAPAADAVHLDRAALDLPDSGRVVGIAVHLHEQPEMAQRAVSRGDTTWRHVTSSAALERLPYPVFPVMLHRTDSGPRGGYPRVVPLPPLDNGPHLSYAVQWFSFALIALVGGGMWLRKQRGGSQE